MHPLKICKEKGYHQTLDQHSDLEMILNAAQIHTFSMTDI